MSSATGGSCVDTFGKAKYVATLDLLKGYWQVPLTGRASEISTFVTSAYRDGIWNVRRPCYISVSCNTVHSVLHNCNAYLDNLSI